MLPFVVLPIEINHQEIAPQAKAELISSVSAIQPGKKFFVAIHLSMAKGWHSYYANPGESGMATQAIWETNSSAASVGPILWPEPHLHKAGGVSAYVYEDELWLTSEVTPPKTPSGARLHLAVTANWLLCKDFCVPQHANLSIDLPFAMAEEPNPQFSSARSSLPTAGSSFGFYAVVKSGRVALGSRSLPPGMAIDQFYPANPKFFGAEEHTVKRLGKGIEITIPLSPYAVETPSRLTGILSIKPLGIRKRAMWLDIPVTAR